MQMYNGHNVYALQISDTSEKDQLVCVAGEINCKHVISATHSFNTVYRIRHSHHTVEEYPELKKK